MSGSFKNSSTVGVIGCGYLGAVHAACLAHWGFDTVAIDIDAWKIDKLSSGSAPFYEDMLDPLLKEGVNSGRLRFSTDPQDLSGCSLVFLCVGTPQDVNSPAADLSQVFSAISMCVENLSPGSIVVGKSTVPVGTATELSPILEKAGLLFGWNPEFLREGTAVSDTLHPERIVVGCSSKIVEDALRLVYNDPVVEGSSFLCTDLATSEIIKESANAFLATKISFINAVADVCDRTGADVDMVAKALGLDSRIGPKFLRSGIGYGGGCFTKDVLALAHRAEELGASSLAEMLRATDSANTNARRRALDLVLKNLPNDPCKVAFLGAAFKPGSDDVRDSPAVWLVKKLQETRKDLTISWFDPAFKEGFELVDISMSRSTQNAVAGAALTVIATDWSDFRSMSPENLSPANKVLIDVRICVSVEKWTSLGWEVHQLGRPSRLPFSQTPAC